MARKGRKPAGGWKPPDPEPEAIAAAAAQGKRIFRWNCGWCEGSGYGGEKEPDCRGCEGRGWHEALLDLPG